MKILVIDDSKTIRLILTRTLKELGHEVIEAEDGAKGLEQVKTQAGLGTVFVDWNMPVMNGLEFVLAARATPEGKTIPIVMVTTENEMEAVKKALDAGVDEFLMKPFAKEAVQDKLALLAAR